MVLGEVREIPFSSERPAYWPVLVVEYDHGAEARRGEIMGEVHLNRTTAEAELAEHLLAYPVREQRPVWYDPRDEEAPFLTFLPPLNFLTFLGAVA